MHTELELRRRVIPTNGVRLHAVEAGPESGPLVILLHGFPEFWYGWRQQIEPLAAAGFRVLVPDQRGYNRSDKPRGAAAYDLDTLALDIVGLIDETGTAKARIVGHDWGGAVAWWLGIKHADRLERLALLNTPHPWVMRRALERSGEQRKKSGYMLFFQLPWLPEWALRGRHFRRAAEALLASSRPGAFTEADLDRYREAWSRPGALTAMLDWYRALARAKPRRPESPRVTVPTLLLWGTEDRFLGRELAQPSLELCDDGHLEFFEGASHWLQHEEPERVNARLIEFLT